MLKLKADNTHHRGKYHSHRGQVSLTIQEESLAIGGKYHSHKGEVLLTMQEVSLAIGGSITARQTSCLTSFDLQLKLMLIQHR